MNEPGVWHCLRESTTPFFFPIGDIIIRHHHFRSCLFPLVVHLFKHLRFHPIVVVAKADVFPPGNFQTLVAAETHVQVLPVAYKYNPPVPCGVFLSHAVAPVCRAIQHENNFNLLQGLPCQAVQQFAKITSGIIHRHDDTYFRRSHKYMLHSCKCINNSHRFCP